ncbi:MAG: type II toxin-antitoxin system PemK/MazF family toxin [Acidobacteria bacterium]|nr:type II toxin-antitoxin system PemK/MazF family toxin [Acidobacteriota bacterium]
MKRGELYRLERPSKRDPKRYRVYLVVSRNDLFATTFPTVVCAPVFSNCIGLETEVEIGVAEGLKHDSCIRCDELVSIDRSDLTHYIGSLSPRKIQELNRALKVALDIE